MKNFKLLFIALLVTCSLLFAISTVKADRRDNNKEYNRRGDDGKKDNDGRGSDGGKNGGSSECLPINNQVWFLIIAGTLIGCACLK